MRRTPEQRKAYLEAQLNSVKAKINKQKRKDYTVKKRETDHLKYTFAGDILKVMGCDVRDFLTAHSAEYGPSVPQQF